MFKKTERNEIKECGREMRRKVKGKVRGWKGGLAVRTHTALAEESSLVPSIYLVANNCP